MKKMTIKQKLLTGFIILATIALGIGLLGTLRIQKLNSNDKRMYNQVVQALGDLNEITSNFQKIRASYMEMIVEKDSGKMPIVHLKHSAEQVTLLRTGRHSST